MHVLELSVSPSDRCADCLDDHGLAHFSVSFGMGWRPILGAATNRDRDHCQAHKDLPGSPNFFCVDATHNRLITFASPQAAEYGKPEDTERRVGGRIGASRDGNRKTHRGLQGKQEGRLEHLIHNPCTPTPQYEKPSFTASFQTLSTASESISAAFPLSSFRPSRSRCTGIGSSKRSHLYAVGLDQARPSLS